MGEQYPLEQGSPPPHDRAPSPLSGRTAVSDWPLQISFSDQENQGGTYGRCPLAWLGIRFSQYNP